MKLISFFVTALITTVSSSAIAGTYPVAKDWLDVPNTYIPYNPDSVSDYFPGPAIVGKDNIIRNEDTITFDTIISGQYVRYSANCRTGDMFILQYEDVGYSRQPISPKKMPNAKWFQANPFQSQVLYTACSINP
jgi:hypothetical protein